jgi:hypothetical protein
LLSLCTVCDRHEGQYFFMDNRSVVFFLFRVVL